MKTRPKTILAAFACVTAAFALSLSGSPRVRNVEDYLGPQFKAIARTSASAPSVATVTTSNTAVDVLTHWNQISIDASGLDHTPVAAGDPRVFGEELGPTRASRAIAIVHIAMFDSVNAIVGGYKSYTNVAGAKTASINAAVAQAAHDTLVAVFPSQKATFDQALAQDLDKVDASAPKNDGIDLGQRAAAAILALRANDGSAQVEPRVGQQFFTSLEAGKWRQDPISQSPIALGANWALVTPFVLQSGSQFRAPAPPALNSAEYTAAYDEAKSLGGDGVNTPTIRTAAQTETAIFWAYDGTPSLCAPPRLYNQIAMEIAAQKGTTASPLELARLLALVNVSLADAGIAVWESKFYYQFWRPVTAIQIGRAS